MRASSGQRNANMKFRHRSRARFVHHRLVGLGLLSGLWLGSCVAQEPYRPSHGTAGSAGGLSLAGGPIMESEAGGIGGAGGSPDTAPVGTGFACISSDQCALPYPYCQPSLGRCVECISARNCAGTERRYCDTRTFECATCLGDTQCTKIAPYCALALGDCVECLSADNCGTSGLTCDRLNYRCVPSCDTNADCASAPQTPFCDPERSLCVSCVNDGDCPAVAPRCSPMGKTCVTCLDDGDCAIATPRCDVRARVCRQCLTNRDCSPGATCVAGACVDPR